MSMTRSERVALRRDRKRRNLAAQHRRVPSRPCDAHVWAFKEHVAFLFCLDPEDWTEDERRLLERIPAEHRRCY